MLATGRILVLLILMANAGFTLALHSCLMSGKPCCGSPMPVRHAQDHPAGMHIVSPPIECCLVTIAGGMNTSPMVSERSPAPSPQKFMAVANLPALSMAAARGPLDGLHLLSDVTLRVGPPPVEKYVLNATFLI
jgi:hypothetical protein